MRCCFYEGRGEGLVMYRVSLRQGGGGLCDGMEEGEEMYSVRLSEGDGCVVYEEGGKL